eukprot:8499246-Karenia_brevis.AAC.1
MDASTADRIRLMTGKVRALPSALRLLLSVAAPRAVSPSGRSNARSGSKTQGRPAGASAKHRC